jgi:L-rhamnose mutarotase
MQRMGMMIGIRPEHIAEYKRLHAHCWPEILEGLSRANIRNYSIFLREPENVMFGYWEYHGTDFKADMAGIAEAEVTKRWWALCGPCQEPLESREAGQWWAPMEEVFHHD